MIKLASNILYVTNEKDGYIRYVNVLIKLDTILTAENCIKGLSITWNEVHGGENVQKLTVQSLPFNLNDFSQNLHWNGRLSKCFDLMWVCIFDFLNDIKICSKNRFSSQNTYFWGEKKIILDSKIHILMQKYTMP